MNLYHICREKDRYDFSKGYIGVTIRPLHKRMKEHLREGNKHLRNALFKYPDIIHYVLVQGSNEYILDLENSLRPSNKMGWNLVPGGGLPPKGSGKGKPKLTIRGSNNYQHTGLFITPKGTFASSTEAAIANDMPRTSLWRLCKNAHKTVKGKPTGLARGFYFAVSPQ